MKHPTKYLEYNQMRFAKVLYHFGYVEKPVMETLGLHNPYSEEVSESLNNGRDKYLKLRDSMKMSAERYYYDYLHLSDFYHDNPTYEQNWWVITKLSNDGKTMTFKPLKPSEKNTTSTMCFTIDLKSFKSKLEQGTYKLGNPLTHIW